MRLVTRCPACATTFKVVRDQLRISDGWVRCGRCSEVFDATLDLQETDDEGAPVAPPAGAAPSPSPSAAPYRPPQESLLPSNASSALPAIHWPAADLLDLGGKSAPTAAAPAPARESATYDPAQDPVPIPSLDADDEDDEARDEPWLAEMMASTEALQAALQSMPASLDVSSSSGPVAAPARQEPGFSPALTTPSPIEEAVNAQLQKALRRERIKALRRERAEQKERERAGLPAQDGADAVAAEVPSAPASAPVAASDDPQLADTLLLTVPSAPASFAVDVDVTQPAPRSAMRKMLWALACLVALAVLLLQVVREERDTLAAREPRLRPVLQAVCEWTGCELAALRQIGAITIDGASFSREKEGEGYRLVFTLRNGARMPLAMPSIELTLLDTQERALVRRVLSPAQFGAGPVLAAAAEHNASLPLQLAGSDAAGLPPVAGYRLIAFYP